MRISMIGFAAVFGLALTSQMQAQATKDAAKTAPAAKAAIANDVRYFTTLGDILGDLPVDAFLKETRSAGKVTSATLDVCYSISATSDRKDRFVVDLKIDGDKLTGAGQSMESNSPVTVNLVRKPANKAITFNGKITVGSNSSLVSSPDNTDVDEKEFRETQVADDDLVESPKDFTEVSPQSVGIRVKREGFTELVKSLRNENVQVALESIITDCNALRTGQQVVRLIVDPARATPLIAKFKALPGVTATGWTSGTYDMERAVKFAASGWINNGKLDRDKIASALSATAAKALAGKPASTKWNDVTGELTFSVTRPSQLAPALNLTETLEMIALIGTDKPNSTDQLIVWLGIPSSKTSDDATGPRLQFAENTGGEDESTFNDDDGIIKAIAAELKGQRWDTDKAAWK